MFFGSEEQVATAWQRWEDNKLFTRKLLRQWKVWWVALYDSPWETAKGSNDDLITAAVLKACAELDHVAVSTTDRDAEKAASGSKEH